MAIISNICRLYMPIVKLQTESSLRSAPRPSPLSPSGPYGIGFVSSCTKCVQYRQRVMLRVSQHQISDHLQMRIRVHGPVLLLVLVVSQPAERIS